MRKFKIGDIVVVKCANIISMEKIISISEIVEGSYISSILTSSSDSIGKGKELNLHIHNPTYSVFLAFSIHKLLWSF